MKGFFLFSGGPRILLCALLFSLSSVQGNAQMYDGAWAPGEFFSQVYDRMGNAYSLNEIKIDSVKGNGSSAKMTFAETCQSGIFKVYFEEGSGFENPAVNEHMFRRSVLCQVLNDLSAFIETPLGSGSNTAKVNLWIRDISGLNVPAGIISYGTSLYAVPMGSVASVGSLQDGEVWKTIHSGKNSYANTIFPMSTANLELGDGGSFYHGFLALDFDNYDWHTDLQEVPAAGYYDLYSVLLKEMAHVLGLTSLLKADGTSRISAGGGQYFTRYDSFLANNSGTQKLLKNTGSCSLYNYSFNSALSTDILSPDCTSGYTTNQTICTSAIQFMGSLALPTYTPACFELLSSLSHFEDECFPSPGTYANDGYFATANHISAQTVRRSFTPEERGAFCDIGYKLRDVFGSMSGDNFVTYSSGSCAGIEVAGVNDGFQNGNFTYIGTVGTPFVLSGQILMSNDYYNNPESSMKIECLEDVYDASTTISNSALGELDVALVTAATPGIHVLRYIPVDMATGKRGNVTYVFLYFYPSSNCGSPDACNLVVNGDFEYSTVVPGHYSDYDFVCGWYRGIPSNTPDYFTSSGNSGFDTPCNVFGYQSGDSYVGMIVTYMPDITYSEILKTKLLHPLEPNTNYTFKVAASLAEGMAYNSVALQMFLSENEVGQDGFGWLDVSTGTSPNGILREGPYIASTTDWTGFTVSFNSGAGGQQYLYIGRLTVPDFGPVLSVPVNSCDYTIFNPSLYSSYMYLDKVSLKETPDPGFHLPQFICEGQTLVDLAQYLDAVSPDGVFSGGGVSLSGGVYVFDPESIPFHNAPFTATIHYTYIDSTGCEFELSDSIQVLAADNPNCSCENTLTLNQPQSPDEQLYQRHEWIVADDGYSVSGSQNVSMKAGDYILFNPHSSFETSAQFEAYIDDCCLTCKAARAIEIEEIPVLALHPNPTRSQLEVALSGATFSKVTVVSFDGRIVFEKEFKSVSTATLQVEDYASGMYILNIQDDTGKLRSEKFIKY